MPPKEAAKSVKDLVPEALAYARWYAALPDERKAEFIISGYQFVADKVRQDVLRENPFATEADVILRFIELTQKEGYTVLNKK